MINLPMAIQLNQLKLVGVASALLPAAPPITPALWLNGGPDFAPEDLDGRLVLIERWATW